MQSFIDFYFKQMVLLEMARPNKLIPSLIGPNLFNRYEELIKKVNYCMKYGKDMKGNDLTDIDGNVVEGLGDEILQDRRYRYFFFYLNRFNETINTKSNSITSEYLKADTDSYNFLKELLLKKDLLNANSATITTKLLIGNAISILNNKKYFLSPEFEKQLLNPTNLATYMSTLRVKNDKRQTSLSAASKRENSFGMGIQDVHGILANTRDERSKMNRDAAYKKRSENIKNLK